MKNMLWPLLLALSCSQGKNNSFTTNGGTADPTNQTSLPALNFRISQAAIDQYSSLLLLNHLETWDDASVPAAWGHLDFPTLRELFRYLHKQDTTEVLQVRHSYQGTRSRLEFTLAHGRTVLLVDRLLQRVEWPDRPAGPVILQKIDHHNWMIEVEGETLLWHVGEQRLCHQDSCVEI